MKRELLFILFICLVTAHCGTEGGKCPLGAPQPIFAPEMAGVAKHHFESAGQESLEELILERGVYLKIHQTGCDKLKQDFQFKVQGDYATYPDSLWLREAVRQFYHLGNLSEKTAGLKMWASAIEAARGEMRLAEPKQVDEGIYIQVDKIIGSSESTLRVVFSQQ
jgi:hypothetical protein